MNAVERWRVNLHHTPLLARVDWLWDGVRPACNKVTGLLVPRGLKRVIKRTDSSLALPSVAMFWKRMIWKQGAA
jgi:hypothetical protein